MLVTNLSWSKKVVEGQLQNLVCMWHSITKVLKSEVIEGPCNLSNCQICQKVTFVMVLRGCWRSLAKLGLQVTFNYKVLNSPTAHLHTPPPPPNDEHCEFMSRYIQNSLIRASSLTLPWVIRGSIGYSGAKPRSSVANPCSSVGHLCSSVTLPGIPGLIRE